MAALYVEIAPFTVRLYPCAPMPFLGEIFSTLAALAWAFAIVFYRKGRVDDEPVGFNLVKCFVAAPLFLLTLVVTGTPFVPDCAPSDWVRLAVSGLIGISLADTLFFIALAKMGAGLMAIVDAAYAPSVILLSAAFLGERMGWVALAGAALVIAAMLVGSRGRPVEGHTRKDVVAGIAIGALAVVAMGVAIVIAKPALDRTPVLWATAVRVSAATIGLLPLALVPRWRAEMGRVVGMGRRWAWAFPGILLGAYGSMILWVAGMKFTLASVASVLNQLSTIFIALFAALFLHEPMGPRRITALVLAVLGALLVVVR